MKIAYRKWGKIRWAKLLRFSRAPRKFSREYLQASYNVICKYKALQKFSCENFIGWNPQKFSPANLSLFTVLIVLIAYTNVQFCSLGIHTDIHTYIHTYIHYIHIYIHTYTHTYIHTHTYVNRGMGRGVSRASGNPLQFSVCNKVSAVAAN